MCPHLVMQGCVKGERQTLQSSPPPFATSSARRLIIAASRGRAASTEPLTAAAASSISCFRRCSGTREAESHTCEGGVANDGEITMPYSDIVRVKDDLCRVSQSGLSCLPEPQDDFEN